MTIQIKDALHYEGTVWSVIRTDGNNRFSPADLNLHPQGIQTNIRHGWWADYRVNRERLLVQNLYIHTGDEQYPAVCGTEAQEAEYPGHRVYRGIDAPCAFTGRILIGKGFIPGYMSRSYGILPWGYRQLCTLYFEDGILKETADETGTAAAVRIAAERYFGCGPVRAEEMTEWITQDDVLKQKAWWIEQF